MPKMRMGSLFFVNSMGSPGHQKVSRALQGERLAGARRSPLNRAVTAWAHAVAGTAMVLVCGGVLAADAPALSFSGFGTVSATYADTQSAQFRASWRQDRGSQGALDWGVDSRLGAQVNASFGEVVSGAAQVLAIRRDGRDRLGVEWLYGQAAVGPDTVVRVGRMALPAFMQSDVRNVGYAQHWARAPAEVYFALPITSVEGAQLLYRHTWGDVTFTAQPTIGQAEALMYFDLGPYGRLDGHHSFRDVRSLHLSADTGHWIARVGQTTARNSVVWVNAPAEEVNYTFRNVGVQYDDGKVLVLAEWMEGRTRNGRYDNSGHYVSVGRRLGRWLPYVIYSELENRGSIISAFPVSRTSALGTRWNVASGVALKAQAERGRLSGQQFLGSDRFVDKRRSVNVYTLCLDFVF